MMQKEKRQQEEALKAVTKRLEHWRIHREKRGPIPPEILKALKPLTQNYPLSWLTEILRVNYGTLKKVKNTAGSDMSRGSQKRTDQRTTFMKIPPPSGLHGGGPRSERLGSVEPERSHPLRTIEFETPQGYKTRFTTPFDSTPHIERLLKTLFESPR